MKIRPRLLPLLLVPLLPLLLLGCGGSDDDGAASGPDTHAATAPAADGGMHHIHGLGVASDSTLQIATHDGLWVAESGQTGVERFGTSRQDVMGFSAVDDRRFLGSGHPAPGGSSVSPGAG